VTQDGRGFADMRILLV